MGSLRSPQKNVMDSAPSRAELPYDPITSPRLRSFDKLDKRQFIKTYLQDQKFHAGSYSADGKAYLSTWEDQKDSVVEEPKAAEPPAQQDAFGTPVLTARVAKPAEDYSSMSESPPGLEIEKLEVPQKTSRKNTQGHGNLLKKDIARKAPNSNQENREVSRPLRSTSKKRPLPKSEDDEHAARLAARRERKRIKKAIVQPKEITESDGTGKENHPRSNLKGKKEKPRKKPKVPAALALMHGFAATNVGKYRLTLKPGASTGVFSKGKASENKQVYLPKPGAKKDVSNDIFCELKFLNKKDAKKLNSKKASETNSSPQYQNSSVSIMRPPKAKESRINDYDTSKEKTSAAANPRRKRARGPEMDNHTALTPRSSVDPTTLSPAASEIWDIELYTSSLACNEPQESSVLLNTTQAVWALKSNKATHLPPDDAFLGQIDAQGDSFNEMLVKHPQSSSLGPSESASQHGQYENGRRVTSKFFVDAKQPAASGSSPRSNFQDGLQNSQPFPVFHEQISNSIPTHQPEEGAYDDNLLSFPHQFLPACRESPSVMDSIDMELQHVPVANADEFLPRRATLQEENQAMGMQYEDTCNTSQGGYSDPLYELGGDFDETWTEEHCYSEQQLDFFGYDPDGGILGTAGDTHFDLECFESADNFQDSYTDYDPEVDHEFVEAYDAADDQVIPEYITNEEEKNNEIELLTQRFLQGRALLLGFSETGSPKVHSSSFQTISNIEVDVAKKLKEHWLPQKL